MTEDELNAKLPIIAHAAITGTDCEGCEGCLVVELRDGIAEVLCDECGQIFASLPVEEVESYFQRLFESTSGRNEDR